MMTYMTRTAEDHAVEIPADGRLLRGILNEPTAARGAIVFAHGSGSGRHSPRNRFVARVLQEAGFATLLLDLLDEEEAEDRQKVFDIELLAERLRIAAAWLRRDTSLRSLGLGYFGASTGAGAALVAAAHDPGMVGAVVSRGGRPELAGDFLPAVKAATLLIVGADDETVVELNRDALRKMTCPSELVVVPGATHLFPEPGALEEVAALAADWFQRHLARDEQPVGEEEALTDEVQGVFRNRADAGRQVAGLLKGRDMHNPLVLAIPRGGVITGAALAEELGAELDVVLSRKLRAPGHQELAVGAIAENGDIYLNEYAHRLVDFADVYFRQECKLQAREIARRKQLFRAVRPQAAIAGRTVIVTDDGIATGSTMIAALQSIRALNPRELIVAVPVAAPDRLAEVRQWCDEAVCVWTPANLAAVGEYYADFRQINDDEVLAVLRGCKRT
jgi:predicted phosphoribosyltransferase/dienelactone hydrolase